MPSSKIIVGFVGQNENGILRHLTEGLMSLLKPHGYSGHVLELGNPNWGNQFDELLKQGIAMAWGHAGIGAKLELQGQCIWDLIKVPFISVLADPPCWRPCNHSISSSYVANAYLYPEWLDVQRRFIQASQLSTLVHGGLVPNPARNRIPWSARPRRMVFIKTGGDPEARRAGWQALPGRWRAIIEDAASAAISRRTGDITDLVVDAAEAHHMVPEQRTDLLFGLMTEVDLFVRETRSTAVARALVDLPVDIYGRGWEHVSHLATQARFHNAFDARSLPDVYAETQFMLNTTPNFSSGVHERVAYGLEARCCVVSDENKFMEAELSGIPTFFPINPRDARLSERLKHIFYDTTDYTPLTQPGLELVTRLFDGERYMLSLLDLAQELRMGEQFTEYRH